MTPKTPTKKPSEKLVFPDGVAPGAARKLQMLRNAVVRSPVVKIAAAEGLVVIIEAIAADLGVTLVRAEEKGGG